MINIDIFDGGRIVTYGTAVADSVLFEKIHFNFPAEWDGFCQNRSIHKRRNKNQRGA